MVQQFLYKFTKSIKNAKNQISGSHINKLIKMVSRQTEKKITNYNNVAYLQNSWANIKKNTILMPKTNHFFFINTKAFKNLFLVGKNRFLPYFALFSFLSKKNQVSRICDVCYRNLIFCLVDFSQKTEPKNSAVIELNYSLRNSFNIYFIYLF